MSSVNTTRVGVVDGVGDGDAAGDGTADGVEGAAESQAASAGRSVRSSVNVLVALDKRLAPRAQAIGSDDVVTVIPFFESYNDGDRRF
jgi:hypothetical protein